MAQTETDNRYTNTNANILYIQVLAFVFHPNSKYEMGTYGFVCGIKMVTSQFLKQIQLQCWQNEKRRYRKKGRAREIENKKVKRTDSEDCIYIQSENNAQQQ